MGLNQSCLQKQVANPTKETLTQQNLTFTPQTPPPNFQDNINFLVKNLKRGFVVKGSYNGLTLSYDTSNPLFLLITHYENQSLQTEQLFVNYKPKIEYSLDNETQTTHLSIYYLNNKGLNVLHKLLSEHSYVLRHPTDPNALAIAAGLGSAAVAQVAEQGAILVVNEPVSHAALSTALGNATVHLGEAVEPVGNNLPTLADMCGCF